MKENEFNNRLYSERYWYNLIRRPILPQEQRHCDMTLGDEGHSDYNLSENWKQKNVSGKSCHFSSSNKDRNTIMEHFHVSINS